MQKTVLITGANRGLGLEFVRQYAEAGWRVIATCRSVSAAKELAALANEYCSVQIETMDIANFKQIDALSAALADEAIDVLLNNAGVYGDDAEHKFGNLDYQVWSQTLTINTLAPIKMAEAFLPQLERGANKLIVSLSSLMGSIADNGSGGSLCYRSSKAALNAAMKSLAIDLRSRSIGVLILHPGWVKTDMGGKNALIEAEESVSGLRERIKAFRLEQTGSFVNYKGDILPW